MPVDYQKAFECFLKAYLLAGYAQPEACYKLGDCFRWGRGVPADARIAKLEDELRDLKRGGRRW